MNKETGETFFIIAIIICVIFLYWFVICPIQVSRINSQIEDLTSKMTIMDCYSGKAKNDALNTRCQELYAEQVVLFNKANEKLCVKYSINK